MMAAMGPQAVTALRLAASGGVPVTIPAAVPAPAPARRRDPWLAASGGVPVTIPAAVPAPAPARRRDPWLAAAVARQRRFAARELARLQERVGELEHALRRARADLALAREAGQREARAGIARTMGGRLPSILTVD